MARVEHSASLVQASRHQMQQHSGDDEETPQLQCHQWALHVEVLLDDEAGCALFERYLKEEECDISDLYFIYACRGLRLEHDRTRRDRCARAIFKEYLRSGSVHAVSDKVKDGIRRRIERADTGAELFDGAVHQVMKTMMRTTYARFIQSDVYIRHVQHAEHFGESADSDQSTGREDLDSSSSPAPLSSDSVEDNRDSSPTWSREECGESSGHYEAPISPIIKNSNRFVSQMPTLDEEEESTPPPQRAGIHRQPGPVVVPPPRPSQRTTILMKQQYQRSLEHTERIDQPGFRLKPNPYHVNNSCCVPTTVSSSNIQITSSGNYTDRSTNEKRMEHHRRLPDIERRKSQRKVGVTESTRLPSSKPRTKYSIEKAIEIANLARKNPPEFHRILCERLQEALAKSKEKERNQAILDKHVQRVFKTPPSQTSGEAPSPTLERPPSSKMAFKSPYQMDPGPSRKLVNNRHTDSDSAIYTCESGVSSTGPLAAPRARNRCPVVDSGCDDSVLSAPTYNSQERKDPTCNKEPEMIVGYQYVGDPHPFVIRLPRRNLRLRDFKAFVKKQGVFKFFFKCTMNDFGTNAVYEEVKDDNQILPLWDGKVFSRIVPVENSDCS